MTVFWSEKNVRKIQLKIVNRVQLNREKLWRKRKQVSGKKERQELGGKWRNVYKRNHHVEEAKFKMKDIRLINEIEGERKWGGGFIECG